MYLCFPGDEGRCGCPAVCFHHQVSVCGSHGLQIPALAGTKLPSLNLGPDGSMLKELHPWSERLKTRKDGSLLLSHKAPICSFMEIGGGHPRNPGPPPGREEHYRDAGHHGSGSSASGGSLRDGCVGAVWSHSAGTAGAFQQHPTPLRQQGENTRITVAGRLLAFTDFACSDALMIKTPINVCRFVLNPLTHPSCSLSSSLQINVTWRRSQSCLKKARWVETPKKLLMFHQRGDNHLNVVTFNILSHLISENFCWLHRWRSPRYWDQHSDGGGGHAG